MENYLPSRKLIAENMRATAFVLNDSPAFIGYHDLTEDWNGFDVPYFTLSEMIRVLDYLNVNQRVDWVLHSYQDELVVTWYPETEDQTVDHVLPVPFGTSNLCGQGHSVRLYCLPGLAWWSWDRFEDWEAIAQPTMRTVSQAEYIIEASDSFPGLVRGLAFYQGGMMNSWAAQDEFSLLGKIARDAHGRGSWHITRNKRSY